MVRPLSLPWPACAPQKLAEDWRPHGEQAGSILLGGDAVAFTGVFISNGGGCPIGRIGRGRELAAYPAAG